MPSLSSNLDGTGLLLTATPSILPNICSIVDRSHQVSVCVSTIWAGYMAHLDSGTADHTLDSAGFTHWGNKRYWTAVYRNLGSSGERLRSHIVAEQSGIGIVAALVATIAVGMLMLKPTDFLVTNQYSTEVAYAYVVLLLFAIGATISCITLSLDLYNFVQRVDTKHVLRWVMGTKGNPRYETLRHMNFALGCLMGAICCLVYLVYGNPLFYVSLAMLFWGFVLIKLNALVLHSKLKSHELDLHPKTNKIVPVLETGYGTRMCLRKKCTKRSCSPKIMSFT